MRYDDLMNDTEGEKVNITDKDKITDENDLRFSEVYQLDNDTRMSRIMIQLNID